MRVYYPLRSRNSIPFPAGTKGFLYHHLPPGRPEYSAQLRFRVTPTDDPASFSQGYDLPIPQIYQKLPGPWNISLVKILGTIHARPLSELLLRDGLIQQHTLDMIHTHCAEHSFSKKARLLFDLSDPFVYRRSPADVARCQAHLFPFSPSGPHIVTLNMLFSQHFQSGTAVFRLEKSPYPQHQDRRVVVLRCMEIWEPFVPRPHCSERHIKSYRPVAGQLLTLVQRTWSLDIDDHKESYSVEGLRMLWDLSP
ncbi:hypothetical protein CVT24_005877 [Panaeolus cyanescens]|uniref:Uncharacterized protein n=1 Tax=Panaeolus cyanescens TaxID=181874 RepID=A0A409YEZ8_9AGAR|nr:hypothetical protein CVT24_005877 [Panaeolus cyanescens]